MHKYVLISFCIGILTAIGLGLIFVFAIPLVLPTQQLAFWLMVVIGCGSYDFLQAMHAFDHAHEFKSIKDDLFWAGIWIFFPYGIEGVIIAFLYGDLIWGGGLFWGLMSFLIGFIALFINAVIKRRKDPFVGIMAVLIGGTAIGFIIGLFAGGGVAILLLILFLSAFISIFTVHQLNPKGRDALLPLEEL